MSAYSHAAPLRIVVLISGSGTNLQAILDAINEQHIPARVEAVISNKADAYGLQRASQAGVASEVLEHTAFTNRNSYDQALIKLIDQYQPGLIVLAGFMRILSDEFVEHYAGRMMNIHPSLLPKYKGLNTHQRVLEAGDSEHGCSVHFVTPELDGGPVILQARVPIDKNETEESLAQKVHQQEYRIYPQAIRWFAEGRIRLDNDCVLFDQQPITTAQRLYQDA